MTSIDVKHDFFTCRQDDDFAIITALKGAKQVLTTVSSKENLMSILETIKDSQKIKGLAILYSDKYPGNTEYIQAFHKIIERNQFADRSRTFITYESAIIQFLEFISKYPIPIVGGMSGDIGPDSLGLYLAFDLRIATERTIFFHPNLQLGFPPSPLLSFYLVRGLGSPKATELMLTKSKFSSQEALDLGLITKIVSEDDLENNCLEKLHELSSIPNHTLVETRRMLQPSINEIRKYLNAGFEGTLRSLYKMKT
ncbi:MAG: enoyl-CoA hydratase/isomerase family protein [Desulfobacterales bacterium]